VKKFCLALAALLLAALFITPAAAYAEDEPQLSEQTGFVYEAGVFDLDDGGFDFDKFLMAFTGEYPETENLKDRTAGSEGERQAALFLARIFSDAGLKTADMEDAGDEEDYLQHFTFGPAQKHSNNVIGVKPAQADTKLNVIIGAHYDNVYGVERSNPYISDTQTLKSRGAYDNGSGVATMLAIAHNLKDAELPFNVTFIAFGAEEAGMLGSEYYVENSISPAQKESILLMVNLDCIAAGDYLYLFCMDWQSGHEDFIRERAENLQGFDGLTLKALPLNKKFVSDPFGAAAYSHYGYFSDNYYFVRENIPSAFFLSMNWQSVKKAGVVESDANNDIMHTKDDNYNMIKQLYPQTYLKHMQYVSVLVADTLSHPEFVAAMQQSRANTPTYAFITEGRNLIIMAFSVWLIFAVAGYIYYGKIKKTADASIKEFFSSPENIERMNKLFKGLEKTPFDDAAAPRKKKFSVFGEEYENKDDGDSGKDNL
jgi:hypothetical protein